MYPFPPVGNYICCWKHSPYYWGVGPGYSGLSRASLHTWRVSCQKRRKRKEEGKQANRYLNSNGKYA